MFFRKREDKESEVSGVVFSREQIGEIVRLMEAVAAGDFTKRLDIGAVSSDHGLLMEGFNALMDKLERRFNDYQLSLNDVVSLCLTESRNSVGIARDAEALTDEISLISAASEELTASIEEIGNASSSAVANLSEGGKKAVTVDGAMQQTASTVEQTSDRFVTLQAEIKKLNESMVAIETTIKLIKEIADQTNLLALNASIEAARAGDAGKGFAVVASEVRKLAENTKISAATIDKSIKEVESHTFKVTREMEALTELMDGSRKQVDQTKADMETMVENLERSIESVSTIPPSIEEQTATYEEVSATLSNITHYVSDTSNRIANSSQHFFQLSNILEKMRGTTLAGLKTSLSREQLIDLAKTDHLLWTWRVENMLSGRLKLEPEAVRDHTACRLGKWFALNRAILQDNPMSTKLEHIHRDFHQFAASIIGDYNHGNQQKAKDALPALLEQSAQVMALLDGLK